MDNKSTIDHCIEKADLFDNLSTTQCEQIIGQGMIRQLQSRSILFHQGQRGTRCYLVTRNQLKLTKLNQEGKEVIIRYVGPGELTAATVIMKNSLYPVTATSIHETEVIGWDKPTMLALMRQFPDMAINLLNIILSRLDDVQKRYLEVCTEQVNQRIARSLLRLMRWSGSKRQDGILVNIPLSRQNIADYSGTTLYTVSRVLSAWEKKGWIKSGREKIIITDPHALVSYSEQP